MEKQRMSIFHHMKMRNNNRFLLVVVFLFTGIFRTQSAPDQNRKDSLLIEFRKEAGDTNYVKTLLRLSSEYSADDYDSSLYYAELAKELSEELGYQSGVAKSYSRIGVVWSRHGKYDSASYVYNQALSYFEETRDTPNMSQTLNNLGLMARYMEKHSLSQEYFLKSLDLKERSNAPTRVIAIAHQNIGINFAIMKDFVSAEEYIKKATDLFRQIGDSTNYYTGLMNLSSIYREHGDYDKSAKTLLKSYEYRLRNGDKGKLGICLYNLGLTHSLNKQYSESIRRYQEARQIFVDLGDIKRMVACDQRMANVYL
jgi:tetratricopeptide (TPR) repeat protein